MPRKSAEYYRTHPNDKAWRNKADHIWSELIRREWPRCPICGNTNTQAHHILTKGAYPKYRHDLNNGIGLCYQCHVGQKRGHISAHGTPRKFDEWLMEHCPDIYEWMQEARRNDGKRGFTWKESYEMLKEESDD